MRHAILQRRTVVLQLWSRCCSSTSATPPTADGTDAELNSLLAQLKQVNTKGKKRAKKPASPVDPLPERAPPSPTSVGCGSTAPSSATSNRIQQLIETEAKRSAVGEDAPVPGSASPSSTVMSSAVPKSSLSRADKSNAAPGAVARPPLTTSEMIQDGAPQHFVTATNEASVSTVRPLLPVSGLTALADVFGRLTAPPRLMEDAAGNGVYAELKLQYCVPAFLGLSQTFTAPLEIEARAYGSELSQFSVQCLSEGDVVHVSGVLLPAATDRENTSSTFVVAALPVGGNVSLALRSGQS